jgi:hypothetical protein
MPRADQVSTAKPARASFSASGRTASLVAPNPCASRIAGTRPGPAGVNNVASSVTCWLSRGPSTTAMRRFRTPIGAGPPVAAMIAAAPAMTRTAAAAASATAPRPRGRQRRPITGP